MYKQFFRFLKEAEVYELWFENRKKWLNSDKFIRCWGKCNKFFPPMYFGYAPQYYLANIFCSFPWGSTPEGLMFWTKINRMWVDSISAKK